MLERCHHFNQNPIHSLTNTSAARDLLARSIVQALESLPEPERRVFVLSHYRGIALDEIARRQQMDKQEVERLHNLAKQHLSAVLNPARGWVSKTPAFDLFTWDGVGEC